MKLSLIRAIPLDPGGPVLLNAAHIEGARPEPRDGRDGFLLFIAGRPVAWVCAGTMAKLRAGQACEGTT
jgi:hypothetical protein